ncbi:unnamed protein product, partial [Phaeothamnion confervicola]
MPMVVLNMGCEMLYILRQRLEAQNVAPEKGRKVLRDVAMALFSAKFVEELFRPQQTSSTAAVRRVFDTVAHSSIMRLNSNSMEKLYDLMTMGFKYQVLCCRAPQLLMQVLLNHIENVKPMVRDADVDVLLDSAAAAAVDAYCCLDAWGWLVLRQSVLVFLKGRRVKV